MFELIIILSFFLITGPMITKIGRSRNKNCSYTEEIADLIVVNKSDAKYLASKGFSNWKDDEYFYKSFGTIKLKDEYKK